MLWPFGANMVDVAIVGAGQTKYGNHQSGMKGMWAEAANNAFKSVYRDFEPKQIGKIISEVLVLGVPDLENEPVLLSPDKRVKNGGKLF